MERPVDQPNRLVELLEHAVRASDPEVALHALSALRRELDAFERVQAWRALDGGSSYGSVARALGISRQAAHRRYRELAAATEPPPGAETPSRLRVAPEARAAVQLAGEEATALGAPRMGSEHLLLGILRAGDPIAAGALRAAGVTVENARMAAAPTLVGEDIPDEKITAYARRVFTEALRAAAADPSHMIGVADLLRSALGDETGGAYRTLVALGVDVDGLRRSL
ncbi:Clp protease N-terminal domain-containing protein [Solirubrobacter soli]|uniref:Clp protease N-terminal domain-containing protein n=1 Tax=Solirubrobacter soli TaxID=363832 RepID=UPI0004188B81|nr:Clp protease N-terminal domain-containing protein [Solirubrobacter soli]